MSEPQVILSDASRGFPPIAGDDARILILGSLPGQKSIEMQQYYGHPQNAFWRIMSELWGVRGDYEERCAQLVENGVALWDVLESSIRPGSMDADIRLDSAKANDFFEFLRVHTGIHRICFNGRTAEQLFRKRVLPGLAEPVPALAGLPSTSPAYASMPFETKLDKWRSMLMSG